MRQNVIIANWKLHKVKEEIKEFFNSLSARRGDFADNLEVIIAPTAIGLMLASELAKKLGISISAQNLYHESFGAFTGEISALQIKDSGSTHVLIGHSERRNLFHEDDSTIRKKISSALSSRLIPIFCIGESLQQRESNMLKEVLERQITYGLEGIDVTNPSSIILAYEPVWAIGTGKTATPQDAQFAHQIIRVCLNNTYGYEFSNKVRIVYGGSVKASNTKALLHEADVDGLLVGGASLIPDEFINIIINSIK